MKRFYYSHHLGPSWEAIMYSLERKRATKLSCKCLGLEG